MWHLYVVCEGREPCRSNISSHTCSTSSSCKLQSSCPSCILLLPLLCAAAEPATTAGTPPGGFRSTFSDEADAAAAIAALASGRYSPAPAGAEAPAGPCSNSNSPGQRAGAATAANDAAHDAEAAAQAAAGAVGTNAQRQRVSPSAAAPKNAGEQQQGQYQQEEETLEQPSAEMQHIFQQQLQQQMQQQQEQRRQLQQQVMSARIELDPDTLPRGLQRDLALLQVSLLGGALMRLV